MCDPYIQQMYRESDFSAECNWKCRQAADIWQWMYNTIEQRLDALLETILLHQFFSIRLKDLESGQSVSVVGDSGGKHIWQFILRVKNLGSISQSILQKLKPERYELEGKLHHCHNKQRSSAKAYCSFLNDIT